VSALTVIKCMQYAVPNFRYIFTSPYDVIHHNIRVFASTDMRTSDPINTTRFCDDGEEQISKETLQSSKRKADKYIMSN